MRFGLNCAAGGIALLLSSAAVAQAQQTSSTTAQQTPTQTQTTTTNSTTTAAPGTEVTPQQTQTTTTRSTATTPTDSATGVPVGPTEKSKSTTTTTTTTAGATAAASVADVKVGVSVYDTKGGLVGKIQSVSGANAVVDTGAARAKIPVSSFAKNDKGLVMNMTKAELDSSAKKAAPRTAQSKPPKKPS